MTDSESQTVISQLMTSAGVSQPAIDAFLDAVARVQQGETGMIPESEIVPIESLTRFDALPGADESAPDLLEQLCVIKLNGGLGTGMGLSGPKSLLKVRGEDTFLDFIARQMLMLRRQAGSDRPAFLLMNSFSTQQETLDYLDRYPKLQTDGPLDFVQNKVPKLDPETLLPVKWPDDPTLEWCPPGHGDLYPSLLGNDNLLQLLLDSGVKYLFVSNADNLGATVDVRILKHFVENDLDFLMEVAQRTESDRKGGHLAQRQSSGRLLLRESAQCLPEDTDQFQDIQRHQFFNTNNLWIRLEAVREALAAGGGTVSLPLIRNKKTVDPQDKTTPPVLQLESAMGAAIERFERASGLIVPRSRFAPVKTTNDLLGVRSDAYVTDADCTVLQLADSRGGVPPKIELDRAHYKNVDDFEGFFSAGPPSLIDCTALSVEGPVEFAAESRIAGTVRVKNSGPQRAVLATADYEDTTIELSPV